MSVAASRRARVITAIADRLTAILRTNGYATDAGNCLQVGSLQQLGKDDPDVGLALTIGTDILSTTSARAMAKVMVGLPFTVHVQVKGVTALAWMAVEAAIADVKKAMEQTADRSLRGLMQPDISRGNTVTFARASGEESQGATITYVVTYEEAFGDPIGA